MSRLIDDLAPAFRPLAVEFLARLTEGGIPVLIVCTRRTLAEHRQNLENGTSWTEHSLHLDGLALDVCPYDVFNLTGPDKLLWSPGPVWDRIGEIGERVALKWGGRWIVKDLGHFQAP